MVENNILDNYHRRINLDNDYSELSSWLLSRGTRPPELDLFPEIGVIVPGVACGFLYKTDSKICYIENLIANPEVSEEDRNKALDVIVAELIKIGTDLGFRAMLGISKLQAVADRSETHGFKVVHNYSLLIKPLI